MAAVLVLSFLFSSRTAGTDGLVRDRVFPASSLSHLPGEGSFLPGSFALGFFLTSFAGMVLLNGVLPGRFRLLKQKGANVFYYVLFVLLAICEVAADTLIPIVALRGAWAFPAAVAMINASFFGAAALAVIVAAGAEREW